MSLPLGVECSHKICLRSNGRSQKTRNEIPKCLFSVHAPKRDPNQLKYQSKLLVLDSVTDHSPKIISCTTAYVQRNVHKRCIARPYKRASLMPSFPETDMWLDEQC